MKTRLNVAIENYKREQARLKRKINEVEWCIKNINNESQSLKEELQSYKEQQKLVNKIINDLEWIGRGEE